MRKNRIAGMHSMSEQIYNYLTRKVIQYFKDNFIKAGDKFYIQFEKEEEVKELYDCLSKSELAEDFVYVDTEHGETFKSFVLNFNGTGLLVAASIDGIHPDYLTSLRNFVGVKEEFKNMGILFIHNSILDSILGGTGSFHREGMPFHFKSIEADIVLQIKNSNLTLLDKMILESTLEDKREAYQGESVSVFAYRDILNVMESTGIQQNQYKEFGLFPDPEARNKSEKEIKERLEKNRKNFSTVADAHNSGLLENVLEKHYDETGVSKLKSDDWESVSYSEVEKSINNRKVVDVQTYKACEGAWDRAQGTTKVQCRTRNVIAFQKEDQSNIQIEFSFTKHVKKEGLVAINDDTIQLSNTGKKIQVEISYKEKAPKFYVVKYNDDAKTKFKFNIVVLSCDAKYFDTIKSKYSICTGKRNVPDYILINTDEAEVTFNNRVDEKNTVEIMDEGQHISLEEQCLELKVAENYNYSEESELVRFNLDVEGTSIPFAILGTGQKTTIIESLRLWKLKRDLKKDFVIIGENKLQQDTSEYCTREEFRKILELEKKYIKLGEVGAKDRGGGLSSLELDISDALQKAFSSIIDYLNENSLLPTLAYLNEELKGLYQNYLSVYMDEVNSLEENEYLTKQKKDLFYVGMIVRTVGDKEIMLTPLHPLNVAYQLFMEKEDTSNISNEEKDILLKLQSRNLLPYITMNPITEENTVYVPVQQNTFPEWNTYIDVDLPRYKGSKDYVSKLVCEKIREFVDHFSYLFDIGMNAPIRINLVNTGDSKEILQGILKYYLREIREKNSRAIQPMEINIYSSEKVSSAFDEFASIDDCETLKELFHLDLSVEDMKEEEVIDLYREKVQFYKKNIEHIDYAHITFMEMMDENKITVANMNDIPTGIAMNGKTSSVPSKLIGDMYRTGFGLKYANENNTLIQLAARLNAMNVALDGSEFHKNSCCTYTISKQSKEKLDEIYDASHWVTFINPMVDLNFFKNDKVNSDLLIIHYSDQYNTTSSGYDAITVTRKSKQYVDVITEYLKNFSVDDISEKATQIINMFNAVNGDWLLRLLSSKSHFPKEKISILSAIKLALARFKMEEVIWVPISLEEIIRVSKGVGLKQSSGLFSVKNLVVDSGSISDDLLMIGIKEDEDNLSVCFYPIEVKIGVNQKQYLEKGIEQAKNIKDHFNKYIVKSQVDLKQEIYCNFFMQLVIASAEKLLLYAIGDGTQGWERITDSDMRRKLLNSEFNVVDTFNVEMKEAAVFSFKKHGIDHEFYSDDILVIEKTEVDGVRYISEPIGNIEKIKWNELEIVTDLEEYKRVRDERIKENEAHEKMQDYNDSVEGDAQDLTAATIEHVAEESVYDIGTAEVEEEQRYMRILFGNRLSNEEKLYWYPNDTTKVTHTNTGIIGTMGTGKTQFTKSMITQIYRESKYNVEGKDVGILIFDYKGDYNKTKMDFVEATNAKVYDLCDLPFNPLALFVTDNPKPMLPMHTANTLKDTLSKAFGLGVKQENTLRNVIMEAYANKGIDKKYSSTWDKTPPTLNDVYDIYINRDEFKEDSLYAAFSNLIDFEIFEPDASKTQNLFDLIQGVTVIDLSGYDPSIQNLVVAITLDLFYSQMRSFGSSKLEGDYRQLNKVILVDEADNFLSKNFASLKNILKEGREFGVGTILSTQLLSHFSTGDNEYANYINTWVVHNVSDLNNKDIRYIFNTQSKADEDGLYNKIKSLKKHESMVKLGDSNNPVLVRDKAFWELYK